MFHKAKLSKYEIRLIDMIALKLRLEGHDGANLCRSWHGKLKYLSISAEAAITKSNQTL